MFLDRDGTLNVRPREHEYLSSAEQFEWQPGALDGMERLARGGFELFVVSNQRGVARGLVSLEALRAIESVIDKDMAARGLGMTAFSYCPHTLERGCDCRKPRPGMLLALADRFSLDLKASWMVGDTATDIGAGRAAGCRTALVGQGPTDATVLAADLRDAAVKITDLVRLGGPRIPR